MRKIKFLERQIEKFEEQNNALSTSLRNAEIAKLEEKCDILQANSFLKGQNEIFRELLKVNPVSDTCFIVKNGKVYSVIKSEVIEQNGKPSMLKIEAEYSCGLENNAEGEALNDK